LDERFRFFCFFTPAWGDINDKGTPVIGVEFASNQPRFFKTVDEARDGRVVDTEGLTELRHDPAVPFHEQEKDGGLGRGDFHPFSGKEVVQVDPQRVLRHRKQIDQTVVRTHEAPFVWHINI